MFVLCLKLKKKMNFKIGNSVFLKNRVIKNKLYRAVTFHISGYLQYVNNIISVNGLQVLSKSHTAFG